MAILLAPSLREGRGGYFISGGSGWVLVRHFSTPFSGLTDFSGGWRIHYDNNSRINLIRRVLGFTFAMSKGQNLLPDKKQRTTKNQ